jgi:hypothetical protein
MSTQQLPDGTQIHTATDVSKAKLRCETHDDREMALFSLRDDGKQVDFYLDERDAAAFALMLFRWVSARAAIKLATLVQRTPRKRSKAAR